MPTLESTELPENIAAIRYQYTSDQKLSDTDVIVFGDFISDQLNRKGVTFRNSIQEHRRLGMQAIGQDYGKSSAAYMNRQGVLQSIGVFYDNDTKTRKTKELLGEGVDYLEALQSVKEFELDRYIAFLRKYNVLKCNELVSKIEELSCKNDVPDNAYWPLIYTLAISLTEYSINYSEVGIAFDLSNFSEAACRLFHAAIFQAQEQIGSQIPPVLVDVDNDSESNPGDGSFMELRDIDTSTLRGAFKQSLAATDSFHNEFSGSGSIKPKGDLSPTMPPLLSCDLIAGDPTNDLQKLYPGKKIFVFINDTRASIGQLYSAIMNVFIKVPSGFNIPEGTDNGATDFVARLIKNKIGDVAIYVDDKEIPFDYFMNLLRNRS